MAKTQDYLDHLCHEYNIAPANSQEELQASQTIANLFDAHGLEPTIQEFDAPATSEMSLGVLFVVMFVGVLLAGVGAKALSIIGLLLCLAAAVLLVMRYLGNDVLSTYGPTAKSQNVIAFHEATGELAAKGNRPIVVVAHYDTTRENILWKDPFVPYMATLKQVAVICVPVVAVAALIQIFGFLPEVARRLLWVVGIFAALPLLLWGISIIASRFMGCTPGVNNNKSGVAAMLGVLDNLRPSTGDVSHTERPATSAQDDAFAEESAGETSAMSLEVQGVRHGQEVLEALHILPETCYIEYHDALAAVGVSADAEDVGEDDQTVSMEPQPAATEEPLTEADQQADEDATGAGSEEPPAEEAAPQHRPIVDLPSIDAVEESPNPVRRTSLFDLPNPGEPEVDPLDNTDGIDSTPEFSSFGSDEMGTSVRIDTADQVPATPQDVAVPDDLDSSSKRKRRGLFSRKKKREEESMSDWLGVQDDYDAKKDGRQIGNWDNFGQDEHTDNSWKGGATPGGRFRVIEGNAPDDQAAEPADVQDADEAVEPIVIDAPDEAALRQAVLSMGDDALISHDVWFVALGGSSLGNAGMKAFLSEYRRQLRGAFLFNLSCVGAGELTVLTQEGLAVRRRADRRLVRLLKETASDIHVDLADGEMPWGDTDATPAMRTSLRSVTIVGCDANNLPAYAHSMDDTEANLDYDQIERVSDLVTEVIRRS